MAEPKRIGRPRKYPKEGVSPCITFRCRRALHESIFGAAQSNGRSLSEEIERRLEASFAPAPDLRTLIREEIRAALAEANFVRKAPAEALLAMVKAELAPLPERMYRY